MTKSALRQKMLLRRRAMNPDDVERLSDQIMTRLMSTIDRLPIRRAHIYHSNSAWNEVSTVRLRQSLATKVPHVVVDVGEPSKSATMPDETYDIIIVPVVAFDSNRQRIGFGGGWYDRFLAEQSRAQKIGLAFEFQRVGNIDEEPHDVALDAVVTEDRIYY